MADGGVYGVRLAPGGGPSWRLVLSAGARKRVIGFIVLGVLSIAAVGVVEGVTGSNAVTAAYANSQLQSDINPVRDAINNYPARATACNSSLACVTALDRWVASMLHTFACQIQAIPMPSARASSAH